MTEVILWFVRSWNGGSELEKTLYIGHPDGKEIMAVRGRTAGAYKNAGIFQWTPGVKAIAVILLRALARDLKQTKTALPLLEGRRGSLASSLDYALNKQPEWLFDMFGSDYQGNSYLRQLLLRSNSGIRRTGSVAISLNEDLLPPRSIKVYAENILVTDAEEFERIATSIANADYKAGDVAALVAYDCDPRNSGLWTLSRSAGDSIITSSENGNSGTTLRPVANEGPDNIYLFEQLQFPSSYAIKDRLFEWSNYRIPPQEPAPPIIVGRAVQAKQLFEELTYSSCDNHMRTQFDQWIASMIPERDWEYGRDREENGEVIPGFLSWIKDHNATDAFASDGLYRTFIWRDRLSGEIVATATLAPDDRDVKHKYNLGGDGHFGGINVRWDLRHKGIGTYIRARLNQHISNFSRRRGKPMVFHQITFNTAPRLAEHGFHLHPLKTVQTSAFGITPVWSKQYNI